MGANEKKLEFYGGEWISFFPIAIFVVLLIVTTFVWGSSSDGALWVPIFLGILITFFFAKDKKEFADAVINGIASRDAAIPIVCWLFAGVFSRILRMSGLADGIAGVAANIGVSSTAFIVVVFLAAAIFATATGTGFGTIAMGMGVLYPAGIALGAHPALLAGAILSGAAFGDSMAPVSDTLISAATAMDADIPGVVRHRVKYALSAGALTLVGIIIAGLAVGGQALSSADVPMNTIALTMFIPLVLTIVIAVKIGDIIIATTIGSVVAAATALVFGLMDFIQIDVENPVKNALIRVSGSGLDRTVDGAILDGLASMVQVIILCLLLFGAISIMRRGHGDIKLLNSLGKVARGSMGAEIIISIMVIAISAVISLTAPAVLLVGASFARPLANKYGIGSYRMANILASHACTFCYSMPWTATMMYLISFTKDTAAPLSGMQVAPFGLFTYAMSIVMFATSFLKLGSKDKTSTMATR